MEKYDGKCKHIINFKIFVWLPAIIWELIVFFFKYRFFSKQCLSMQPTHVSKIIGLISKGRR